MHQSDLTVITQVIQTKYLFPCFYYLDLPVTACLIKGSKFNNSIKFNTL